MTDDIDALCATCQDERLAFRKKANRSDTPSDNRSPGCNRLLRLALERQPTALQQAQIIFEPFVQQWVAPRIQMLDGLDADEVGHDAWVDFCLSAPKYADELLANEQIGRAVSYMLTCARNAILMYKRKQHPTIDNGKDLERLPMHGPDYDDLKQDVRDCINRLCPSTKELLIVVERLLEGRSSQDIAKDYLGEFLDIKDVYRTTERVIAKLKSDPDLRSLANRAGYNGILAKVALLSVDENMSPNSGNDAMTEQSCPISDSDLLDYVTGQAEAMLVAQVEASPGCVGSAQLLEAEMAVLQPLLRLAFCLDTTDLVAYHDGLLRGTQRLLVWKHIRRCPHCTAELDLLDEIDAIPDKVGLSLGPIGRVAKMIVQAIFIAPELRQAPLRGEVLEFETAQANILIQVDQESTTPARWGILGRVQFKRDGLAPIQSVTLVCTGVDGQIRNEVEAHIELGTGHFETFTLPSGYYDLLIVTITDDIVINGLPVGHNLRTG